MKPGMVQLHHDQFTTGAAKEAGPIRMVIRGLLPGKQARTSPPGR